jgi:hypothetical protein
MKMSQLSFPPFQRPRSLHQIAGLDAKRIRDLTKHCHAGRYVASLDRADVSHAKACSVRQLLLRQLLVVACLTQVSRHDLFEIHDKRGISIGTVVLGMIVPIRNAMCYLLGSSSTDAFIRAIPKVTRQQEPQKVA